MTDFGMTRSLAVLADGEPVTGFSRARLTGKETLGLYPMPFLLRLWNLSGPEACRLASAGELTVLRDSAVLAAGRIADACRVPAPEGTVTEAVFSAGLGLWEAPVSLSVEAGGSWRLPARRSACCPFPGRIRSGPGARSFPAGRRNALKPPCPRPAPSAAWRLPGYARFRLPGCRSP